MKLTIPPRSLPSLIGLAAYCTPTLRISPVF